jgi:predicted MPP superfamily phosphohydrolase
MRPRLSFALLFLLFLYIYVFTSACVQAVQSTSSNPQVQSELAKLSPALAEQARAMLAETDDRKRAQSAIGLLRKDANGALDFLLAVLSAEQSPSVRLALVDSLGRYPNAKVREQLAKMASSDADVRVSLLAIERLRAQSMQETRDLLKRRLDAARRANDEAAVTRLAAEQERWISLARGTMLPAFLRTPPALFSLKPENQAIRLVAFGDFGTGSAAQKQAATAILELHKKNPYDFGITLGDNFYTTGMSSPTDPRWKSQWEDLYEPLKIKFYATLGNHDWGQSDSPAAEILYSSSSPSWRMPAPYYTFTAGSVQFFALDTNEVSEAQLMWLDGELKKSTAKWKIVYGHHPIYSDGEHGDDRLLIEQLLPLLKNRVDIYLVGHDHIFNHIKPEAGVHFFVAGVGGAGVYKVKPTERTLFAQSVNGFASLEADSGSLTVRFVGVDTKQLYEYSIRK